MTRTGTLDHGIVTTMTGTTLRSAIDMTRALRIAARSRHTTLLGALVYGLWNGYNLFNDPTDMVISSTISILVVLAGRIRLPRHVVVARP